MKEEQNRWQVTAIALLTAICLLGDSFLYIALPTHWREIGLHSPLQVGILLSVNRFIRLPLGPIIGWLYQRINMRSGIMIAILLAIITTASYGLLHNFWALLVMRCLWGAAWTFLRIGAFFTILEVAEDWNRGAYFGRYNGLYRLGSLVGMLVGGLLADLFGITAAALLFAALALPALPAAWRMIPASKANASQHEDKRLAAFWREPRVLWALAAGFVITMLFNGVFTSTLSYVLDARQPALTMSGWVLGAATLAGILQAIRWAWEPWLAPRFGHMTDGKRGRAPFFILALAAAAALFFLIPLPLSPLVWIAILLAVQLVATALTTVTDAIASDSAVHSSRAAVMTAYSVSTDLGAALGPTLAFLIVAEWGISQLYWASSFLFFLLAVRWGYSHFAKTAKNPHVSR